MVPGKSLIFLNFVLHILSPWLLGTVVHSVCCFVTYMFRFVSWFWSMVSFIGELALLRFSVSEGSRASPVSQRKTPSQPSEHQPIRARPRPDQALANRGRRRGGGGSGLGV